VQYGETDFAFACRMLEDAAISYYFEQSEDGSKLVLDDEPQSRDIVHPLLQFHDSPGVLDSKFVTRLSTLQAVRPGRMTIGDLDYRKPSTSQPRLSALRGLAQESALEQFDYEPGAFLYQGEAGGSTPAADDRGASRTDTAAGGEKTENRLLARRQGDKRIKFESNVVELSPGSIVTIFGHPHRVVTPESGLLVVSSVLDGEHDGDWRVSVDTVSTAVPYRPAQITPKPIAVGLESATVVGPGGDDIHTDEYGRVRVHFHWDRESNRSDTSSCWLPTSQPWAGTSFGGVNLPRIGQEVLVEFLGGDPDRPIVIGRVYTETNPPPDKLPKYKTVSGIISESTPRMVMGAADGTGASPAGSPLGGGTPMSTGEINGYVSEMGAFQADSPTGVTHSWQGSGMKFDDNKGTQKVYMQAQKDFNIVVNDCWRTIVGNDRGCIVGTDDQLTILNVHDTSIAKDQEVTVKGNQTLSVFERRAEQVDGNLNLEVGPGGFHIESTKERINYEAKKLLMIESKQKITFKVKGSTITMEPGVITIRSADKTIFQSKEGGGN
jgi:type VI secretion system secreted protein VgrG